MIGRPVFCVIRQTTRINAAVIPLRIYARNTVGALLPLRKISTHIPLRIYARNTVGASLPLRKISTHIPLRIYARNTVGVLHYYPLEK